MADLRSLVLDSHQFIDEFLVVVADAEDVLLILLPSRSRIDSIRAVRPIAAAWNRSICALWSSSS
jgi:hypothetical protein